ncbi:MAG: hypothetical protein ACK4HW_00495 [Roseinatronobacter sp.]
MKLLLSPIRADQALNLTIVGHVLTLNGVDLDFTPLPVGAILPHGAIDCDWIAGDVTRDLDCGLIVPLLLPHGAKAPQETLFPAPIVVTADGPVQLPPYDTPESPDAD